MKLFTSVHDIPNVQELVQEAISLKKSPYTHSDLGQNKTIGCVFLNPSLRTRLSTQKAAQNLGMTPIVLNADKEAWALEFEDDVIMNGTTVEHVKESAAVMGKYFDILAIRCFPGLVSREDDYSEKILNQFIKYAGIPVISLESGTRHPLQSFADLITITEHKKKDKPKVVLTWAPHVKALPQAVPNSFAEWMCKGDVDFVITHPEGYELDEQFTWNAKITHNQDEALKDADFVYVKNWSTYKPEYGKILTQDASWLLTNEKLKLTNNAGVMHCLPVRRGMELSNEVLDGPNSLVIQQAENRIYSAQAVIKKILETIK